MATTSDGGMVFARESRVMGIGDVRADQGQVPQRAVADGMSREVLRDATRAIRTGGLVRETSHRPRRIARPPMQRAPASPRVVADEAPRAHGTADLGRGDTVGVEHERERDGERAVVPTPKHAAWDYEEHRAARETSVATGQHRRDRRWLIARLRPELKTLPPAVPVHLKRCSRSTRRRPAGGAPCRARCLHRRPRRPPILDVEPEVDDSSGASPLSQWMRSTTGDWPPNPPPSSISVDR